MEWFKGITCRIDTDTVNFENSSRPIGGKRLSLNALVKAYSLRPGWKNNWHDFSGLQQPKDAYDKENYMNSKRTWMQLHRVECSDATTQSTISANVPGHEERTESYQLNKKETIIQVMKNPIPFVMLILCDLLINKDFLSLFCCVWVELLITKVNCQVLLLISFLWTKKCSYLIHIILK